MDNEVKNYPPEGKDCEWTVGLVGAAVGEGRSPEVVPQQLRERCRWQHIGIGLYGSAEIQREHQGVRRFIRMLDHITTVHNHDNSQKEDNQNPFHRT